MAWIDLLNNSSEFGRWDLDRLKREMLSTLVPGGGIFLAQGERLIGCSSVCCMEQYRPNAILMFVALLSDFRGRGLGQILLWEALRVAQSMDFPGMILHTENHRYDAIRTYFRLGFLPQLAVGVADSQQWSAVLNNALLNV